jgi:hypothetical protein
LLAHPLRAVGVGNMIMTSKPKMFMAK